MEIRDWYNEQDIIVPTVSGSDGYFDGWHYGTDYKNIYVNYSCGSSLTIDTETLEPTWR